MLYTYINLYLLYCSIKSNSFVIYTLYMESKQIINQMVRVNKNILLSIYSLNLYNISLLIYIILYPMRTL